MQSREKVTMQGSDRQKSSHKRRKRESKATLELWGRDFVIACSSYFWGFLR